MCAGTESVIQRWFWSDVHFTETWFWGCMFAGYRLIHPVFRLHHLWLSDIVWQWADLHSPDAIWSVLHVLHHYIYSAHTNMHNLKLCNMYRIEHGSMFLQVRSSKSCDVTVTRAKLLLLAVVLYCSLGYCNKNGLPLPAERIRKWRRHQCRGWQCFKICLYLHWQ